MRETLQIINQMRADGVIDKYAIGGAVGATLYVELASTVDVQVFVTLPGLSSVSEMNLSPIYEYLRARGCKTEGEYIVRGTWPVQFLPVGNPLQEEALTEALETEIDGVRTWVMRAEHLIAIDLQTERTKDHTRILQFLEQRRVDSQKLDQILKRHGLVIKWKKFKERYLDG